MVVKCYFEFCIYIRICLYIPDTFLPGAVSIVFLDTEIPIQNFKSAHVLIKMADSREEEDVEINYVVKRERNTKSYAWEHFGVKTA